MNRYDVFISYSRDTGSSLAQLVRERLERHGIRVFLDVRNLSAGRFDEALLREIEATPNFLLLLTPGSLSRCQDPGNWVRREIAHALSKSANLVALRTQDCVLPAESELPEELRPLLHYEIFTYSHEYSDESLARVRAALRGSQSALRRTWILAPIFLLLLVGAIAASFLHRRALEDKTERAALVREAEAVVTTPPAPIEKTTGESGPIAASDVTVLVYGDGGIRVQVKQRTVSLETLARGGIDVAPLQKAIADVYSILFKIPAEDTAFEPSADDNYTWRTQSTGSHDPRYENFHFELSFSDGVEVTLFHGGRYLPATAPESLGIDWNRLSAAAGQMLAVAYHGKKTPHFAPVRLVEYGDSRHYGMKYVLKDAP